MIRSMYTAISALRLHQDFMDVVADNLANANTYGFKSSRFSFQDQFAQIMSVGSGPTDTQGGVDPVQIGLGTRAGTSTPTFTQGSLQNTGRNTDLAIEGDGFFVYKTDNGNQYSRDGMINMDATGYLVNSGTGFRVQGWNVGANGKIDTSGAVGDIQLPLDATIAKATANATVSGNLDSTVGVAAPNNTFTTTIGVYDSLGNLQPVNLTFTHTGNAATGGTWSWAASGTGVTSAPTGLVFDSKGQYVSGGGTLTVAGSGGASNTTVTLDLSGLTQLATGSSAGLVNQDGVAAGNLTSFIVAPQTGEVYGQYSNGLQQLLGQVALAKFTNPAGLIRTGSNMFAQGLNSGEASVGAADTGGRGVIAAGYLEGSNVDMSQEFTNMILAERGFQASSRIITTSDQILQELVNLGR